MFSKKEAETIRELAKTYMEIALSDRHVRMRKRFLDNNNLNLVRPPLIIEEIPWQQMNIDGALDCVCENDRLRDMEYRLRQGLFREKYLKCDNYIEPVWPVYKSFSSTGCGLTVDEISISADLTDIRSHHYEDTLSDESALEKFHLPVITAYPEKDKENVDFANEILGDIIPVQLRGHQIYIAPWDYIARLRGMETILWDIFDNPDYLHRIISLYITGVESEMDQKEALGLYDPRALNVHCTPSPVTVENPSPEGSYSCSDMWFRTMAQMFSSISPEQHYEFDVQYTAPLAKRCAYTYYGCCEPLHDRIDMLRKAFPNLRKIGVSPWADVERSAEQIRGDYVLSRKPNPANVAGTANPDVIRKEISETAEICLKYGCPCDITLKDISTVGNRPENLVVWAETASGVLDAFYGKD